MNPGTPSASPKTTRYPVVAAVPIPNASRRFRARRAADPGGEWWVGELYFAYEENFNPDAPLEYTTKNRELRELQDDYHRIIIEEINALSSEKRPKGLIVGGYAPGSLYPVLTEESKAVIKNFFVRDDLS